jgi:putative flippase GtrA
MNNWVVRLNHYWEYLIRHRGQLLKFALVGGLTFCIYLLLFHLFYGVFAIGYKVATTVAYTVTVACHFGINRNFTFSANGQGISGHMSRYLIMLVLNYAITLGAMMMIVEVAGLSPYWGTIASTVITAGSSFFMMKHFVFQPQKVNE